MKKKMRISEPYDEGFEVSIKEFAEDNDLDYLEAQGFIKTLVKMGVAKQCKSRKVEGARGKPTNIYMVPTNMNVIITEEADLTWAKVA